MLASLRSRLWLSYALVITVALGVISVVLFIYILRNPLINRQAAAKLLVVQGVLLGNQNDWQDLPPDALQSFIDQVGTTYNTRIVIFEDARQVVADSMLAEYGTLQLPRFPRLRPAAVMRDNAGNTWLYLLRQLDNQRWLLVSVPRPIVPLMTFLRDDLFLPVVGAGIVALALSLFMAFVISRWVGDPLQRMITASKRMPDSEAVPIPAEGPREVQELIHVFNDMTSRVQISKQSQREFVANVSHELKTPITVIQGFAQAILDGTAASPDAQKQAVQVIYEESGLMHRLVVDLLDLARMDAGTFVLKHESVDMGLLLQHVVERFMPQAQQSKVSLTLSAARLPNVYGDSDRLAQVFTNLVDNALKYTPAGGIITVSASGSADQLRVEVKDSGVGIPPEALASVFDRFYQADASRMGGEKHGAGLGLAIVREIVQAHRGTITARSTLGQGSTFTVNLPLALPDASTINRRRKSD